MAEYNGKVIYNPSGKAGEYSYWAANFYVGCSNGCDYCYLKKGRGAKVLGGDIPTLKKTLHNPHAAMYIFEKEVKDNLEELQKNGLFFSFTTDPLLSETAGLTIAAVEICQFYRIPVKILTKCCGDGLTRLLTIADQKKWDKSIIAIGFTITGHDEREKGADTTAKRISMFPELKQQGYKTFASVEPVIDFDKAFSVVQLSLPWVDLYKIGLESGKQYKIRDTWDFITRINVLFADEKPNARLYLKDGILKNARWERKTLPGWCVERNHNLFI